MLTTSQPLLCMSKHTAGVSGRTKHIDVAFHFIRHREMRGDLKVFFVPTEQMKAAIMTKSLPGPAHVEAVEALGMYERGDSF
jgi:hypothetical protein